MAGSYNKKMRLFTLAYFFLLFSGCTVTKNHAPVDVLEISSGANAFNLDTKSIYNIGNDFRIVSKGDRRLYILSRVFMDTRPVRNDSGRVIGDKVVGTDTTYWVYASQKGKKHGIKYGLKSFRTDTGTIFSVDSLLTDLLIGPDNLKIFDQDIGKPIEVLRKGNVLTEKYVMNKYVDTIYRFYNKDLKDIDFSFSKRLDEEHQSKLYKTLYINNPFPKGTILPDQEVPRREIFYEVKQLRNNDVKTFEEIFEKFGKDGKILHLY